jgi:hypothetical protein
MSILVEWSSMLCYWAWLLGNAPSAEENYVKAAKLMEIALKIDDNCISHLLRDILTEQRASLGKNFRNFL